MNDYRIFALDPSVENCGFALLSATSGATAKYRRHDSGTWHPSKAKGKPDRLEQLGEWLSVYIRTAGLADVAVEIPDGGERFARRGATVVKLGGKSERTYAQAVGVCRGAASAAGARVWPVTVTGWKGTARKSYTTLRTSAMLGYEPGDDNEADALGIALWWVNQQAAQSYRSAVESIFRK